jgi:hypothetical protein
VLYDVDGLNRFDIAVSAVRSVLDQVNYRRPSNFRGHSVVKEKSDGDGRVDWIASASSLLASPYR